MDVSCRLFSLYIIIRRRVRVSWREIAAPRARSSCRAARQSLRAFSSVRACDRARRRAWVLFASGFKAEPDKNIFQRARKRSDMLIDFVEDGCLVQRWLPLRFGASALKRLSKNRFRTYILLRRRRLENRASASAAHARRNGDNKWSLKHFDCGIVEFEWNENKSSCVKNSVAAHAKPHELCFSERRMTRSMSRSWAMTLRSWRTSNKKTRCGLAWLRVLLHIEDNRQVLRVFPPMLVSFLLVESRIFWI